MVLQAELFGRARQCHQAGDLRQAEQLYRQLLTLYPAHAQGWYLLGVACVSLGMLDDAATALRQSTRLRPDFPEAHNHLGVALIRAGRIAEAIASFEQAVRLRPAMGEAHLNLGLAFTQQWKLDEAEASLREAVRYTPASAEAHRALGLVLLRLGKAEEAAESYRTSLRLNPTDANVHSAILLALHYGPHIDRTALFEEHRRWAKQHADRLAPATPVIPKNRDTQRKLRIGYVSADFREHPVAYTIGPLLAAHDRSRFEVIGYCDVPHPDAVTQRLASLADEWRSIERLNDEAVADLIRKDEIDIAVDLTGHAGKGRLLAFARKPAPIQVTYFGYPDTTGLGVMDYRITDAYADPPGTDVFHTEKLVRLPETAWCYAPGPCPDVQPSPALETGFVTFASFNNMPKVTSDVIAVWAKILQAIPDSRLKLLTNSTGRGDRRIWDFFSQHQIQRERILIVDRQPRDKYLDLHHSADIGLDPFPYNGAVTSCDALWMGVPVVTMAGDAFVSRQGVSLLTNLGLTDLIATSPDEYVTTAVGLAENLAKLNDLRMSLRGRMLRSPIMDAPEFTRKLEDEYRRMWKAAVVP